MTTEMTFAPHALSSRAVIALTGLGVAAFLDNILSCNVEGASEERLAYGALLSPQGKILHDIFVHPLENGALLDCTAAGRDDLIAKLKLYRLRAKFEITPRDDLDVVAGLGVPDPRLPALGRRAVMPKGFCAPGEGQIACRFALGVAEGHEVESLFPHEANFDMLNGVDFKKGCYVGQEIVSRMQHRGTTRSRILPVSFATEDYADDIRDGEQLMGQVVARRGKEALALLKLERLDGPLPFTLRRPEWMKA